MGFEIQPERVRRGSIAPVIALVVGGMALVAAALLASVTGSADPRASVPLPSAAAATGRMAASSVPAATRAGEGSGSALVTARPIPPVAATTCHDLGPVRCRAVVVAAVRRLPPDAPPVVSVDAWSSLVCGDARDCPSSRFEGNRPFGSAVIRFAAGRGSAWLNVVAPDPDRRCTCGPIAWIIRWFA